MSTDVFEEDCKGWVEQLEVSKEFIDDECRRLRDTVRDVLWGLHLAAETDNENSKESNKVNGSMVNGSVVNGAVVNGSVVNEVNDEPGEYFYEDSSNGRWPSSDGLGVLYTPRTVPIFNRIGTMTAFPPSGSRLRTGGHTGGYPGDHLGVSTGRCPQQRPHSAVGIHPNTSTDTPQKCLSASCFSFSSVNYTPAETAAVLKHYSTDRKHYTAGDKHHTAGRKHYTAGDKHHTAGRKHYTAGDKHHTAGRKHYTAGDKHHTAGRKHYTAGDKHHTAGRKRHTAGDKHHSTGSSNIAARDDTPVPRLTDTRTNSDIAAGSDLRTGGMRTDTGGMRTDTGGMRTDTGGMRTDNGSTVPSFDENAHGDTENYTPKSGVCRSNSVDIRNGIARKDWQRPVVPRVNLEYIRDLGQDGSLGHGIQTSGRGSENSCGNCSSSLFDSPESKCFSAIPLDTNSENIAKYSRVAVIPPSTNSECSEESGDEVIPPDTNSTSVSKPYIWDLSSNSDATSTHRNSTRLHDDSPSLSPQIASGGADFRGMAKDTSGMPTHTGGMMFDTGGMLAGTLIPGEEVLRAIDIQNKCIKRFESKMTKNLAEVSSLVQHTIWPKMRTLLEERQRLMDRQEAVGSRLEAADQDLAEQLSAMTEMSEELHTNRTAVRTLRDENSSLLQLTARGEQEVLRAQQASAAMTRSLKSERKNLQLQVESMTAELNKLRQNALHTAAQKDRRLTNLRIVTSDAIQLGTDMTDRRDSSECIVVESSGDEDEERWSTDLCEREIAETVEVISDDEDDTSDTAGYRHDKEVGNSTPEISSEQPEVTTPSEAEASDTCGDVVCDQWYAGERTEAKLRRKSLMEELESINEDNPQTTTATRQQIPKSQNDVSTNTVSQNDVSTNTVSKNDVLRNTVSQNSIPQGEEWSVGEGNCQGGGQRRRRVLSELENEWILSLVDLRGALLSSICGDVMSIEAETSRCLQILNCGVNRQNDT